MELNEITKVLYDRSEEENNRSVVCIATEKVNDTEKDYYLSTTSVLNEKLGIMANAIADMMKKEKGLEEVAQNAPLLHRGEQEARYHNHKKGGQR